MATQKAKSGKKHRKHDRNKKWCLAYSGRKQREKNKARRIRKHLLRFPADHIAVTALQNCFI